MTHLTHSKARSLLQAAADRSLEPADKSALDAHLQGCEECLAYANQMKALEGNLRQVFHRMWDKHVPELNLQAVASPSPVKHIWGNLFRQTPSIGKLTAVAALLAGYILITNLFGIRTPIVNNETPTVIPTPNGSISNSSTSDASPTPLIQTALTGFTIQPCNLEFYKVQKSDTLDGIAEKYGIAKETILQFNPGDSDLAANRVVPGTELAIPVCESAPSRTVNAPGSTLTLAPLHETLFPEQPQ